MTVYVNWGSGELRNDVYTQEELRNRWELDQAASVFRAILGESLLPFIGTIDVIGTPPKSTGVEFHFASGTQARFARLIRANILPSPAVKTLSMRRPRDTDLIPDEPEMDPSRNWRSLAAKNAIGASFRQADTGTSLHIAFNENSCDVHVDRMGFVVNDGNGLVHWDLQGLIRQLTTDLEDDKIAWLIARDGVVDEKGGTVIQATIAPWFVIDLPSKDNGGHWEAKVGYMISGRFDENAIVNRIRR